MTKLERERTDYIVVHCSATTDKQDIGRAEIDRWHRAKGWFGIGYHFVIRRDGTVEVGRPLKEPGAHVAGYNHNSVGICMVGGVDANDTSKAVNNFTPKQFESLAKLVKELKQLYPKATVQGHRDFPGVAKACPCFNVKSWVAQLDK